MKNAYHRGKRVSVSHAAMLAAYERERGSVVHINQGRRTLAEQAMFWARYQRYGWPVAARPWGGAPHIKWGREHHALDINAPHPAQAVAAFYRSKGVPVAFNVRNEPWHLDTLDEAALKRAASRLGGTDPVLRRGQTGPSVIRLKKLLHDRGLRGFGSRFNPYFNKATENAVKRLQARNDLRADGVVGPATWALLRR